jgi:hypothetical protein
MTVCIPWSELQQATTPDGQWHEPAAQRQDKWPKLIRRDCWLVQDTTTGHYMSVEGGWVAHPEQAWSCLWVNNTIAYLRFKFGEQQCRNLQLRMVTFYCDPKTFPVGWFADE